MGQVTPANGGTTIGASNTQSAAPVSSGNSMQNKKDYDFSYLTQGMHVLKALSSIGEIK